MNQSRKSPTMFAIVAESHRQQQMWETSAMQANEHGARDWPSPPVGGYNLMQLELQLGGPLRIVYVYTAQRGAWRDKAPSGWNLTGEVQWSGILHASYQYACNAVSNGRQMMR